MLKPREAPRAARLVTRGSKLALAQSEYVARLLRERWPGLAVELVAVTTHGDRHQDVPLAEMQAPDGVFTRGVEAELLTGRAEIAVHSLKDLPTATDPALVLAAFPGRADPRDVLVSRHGERFDELPRGAMLGTSSPRRAAQALAARPDLRAAPIRGNVDTRLRKLEAGEYDALILAAAGLERLGLIERAVEVLPIERFTPAVGQGVLAVQCRADDAATRALLAAVDDPAARAAVTAERTFLRAVGGGCRLPLAGYAELCDGRLVLHGFLSGADGTRAIRDRIEGPPEAAEALGQELGERMLAAADPAALVEVRGG